MTCPKCNFQNPEGELICHQCQAILAVPKPPVSILEIPTVIPLKKWLWVWAGAPEGSKPRGVLIKNAEEVLARVRGE